MWKLFVFVVVAYVSIVNGDFPLTRSISSLTQEQRAGLVALRERMEADFTSEFLKEDRFLAGWLTRYNFELDKAAESLQEYLSFRIEQKLDTILEEDWEELRAKYPYSSDTVDKSGKPLAYIDLGEWNMCDFTADVQPATAKLERYMHMIMMDMEGRLRRLLAAGRDVTNFRYIINAGGLTPEMHGCSEFERFIRFMTNHECKFSPEHYDKLAVIVNVPNSFKKFYSIFSSKSKLSADLYGQDRSQWEAKLLEEIEPDQLPKGLLKEIAQRDNSEGLLNWHQEL